METKGILDCFLFGPGSLKEPKPYTLYPKPETYELSNEAGYSRCVLFYTGVPFKVLIGRVQY